MSLTMINYVCANPSCGRAFQRRSEGKRTYRFCCNHCANVTIRKLRRELLVPYAERGTKIVQIAAELNISPSSFPDALRRFGLYNLWASRRYKKCAVAA